MAYLNHGLSDHTYMLVCIDKVVSKGGKPFRFFNILARHPQFLPIVDQCWKDGETNSMKAIWLVLKGVKAKLKGLHNEEYRGVKERIDYWRNRVDVIQADLVVHPINVDQHLAEREAIGQLKRWINIESSISKQKARVQWLKEGDQNTRFFHCMMKSRSAVNRIQRLVSDSGEVVVDSMGIKQEILGFYKQLLGSRKEYLKVVDTSVMHLGPSLQEDQRRWLIREVEIQEVYSCLQAISTDSAPGVDE